MNGLDTDDELEVQLTQALEHYLMAAAAADLLHSVVASPSLGKRALAREWCCSHRTRWMGTVDGGFPSM